MGFFVFSHARMTGYFKVRLSKGFKSPSGARNRRKLLCKTKEPATSYSFIDTKHVVHNLSKKNTPRFHKGFNNEKCGSCHAITSRNIYTLHFLDTFKVVWNISLFKNDWIQTKVWKDSLLQNDLSQVSSQAISSVQLLDNVC